MSRRLLVNDALSQLGERTFWHMLQEWFGCEFVGGEYNDLAIIAESRVSIVDEDPRGVVSNASLIIRNATWFPPIKTSTPTISILQDIIPEGPMREMQKTVIQSSEMVVFNSAFTESHYFDNSGERKAVASMSIEKNMLVKDRRQMRVIPLPVDFTVFEPQNAMACQQALSLPDGAVCWIGASHGAAGHVKGFDIFMQIVRTNPDIPFVGVFKDAPPESYPPNLRVYVRLPHADLVKVIGACRVGLCTSRTESQHLAGIEMGACGLPMVAPLVGIYWNGNISGVSVQEPTVPNYATAIRAMLATKPDGQHAREFWQKQCDIPVVRAQWEKLVAEVECSGQS